MKCGGGQLLNWGPHIVDHALQFLDSPVAGVWSDLKRVSAVGDAEDHLKIVVRRGNGRVVDLEISGGSAMAEPPYAVYGTKGALRCDDQKKIRLRYVDPTVKLARRRAKSSTPPLGGFGSNDELKWIEEEIDVDGSNSPEMIWDHLYAAIREGVPFPITLAQSLNVMKVISAARKGTTFETAATR